MVGVVENENGSGCGHRAGSLFSLREWLHVAIAGFAFGNIMLFSLPLYLGLDSSGE